MKIEMNVEVDLKDVVQFHDDELKDLMVRSGRFIVIDRKDMLSHISYPADYKWDHLSADQWSALVFLVQNISQISELDLIQLMLRKTK